MKKITLWRPVTRVAGGAEVKQRVQPAKRRLTLYVATLGGAIRGPSFAAEKANYMSVKETTVLNKIHRHCTER